jgi:hypothetical protein
MCGRGGSLGPADETAPVASLRYVERNRCGGLVERAEEYPWSSAARTAESSDAVLSHAFPPPASLTTGDSGCRVVYDEETVTVFRPIHAPDVLAVRAHRRAPGDILQRALRPNKRARRPRLKTVNIVVPELP